MLLFPTVAMLPVALSLGYTFTPDYVEQVTDPRIPVLYDAGASQTLPYSEAPVSGSSMYSFATTSTGKQYFLAMTVFASAAGAGYGANILDLDTLERHSFTNATAFTNQEHEAFDFARPGYRFTANALDNLGMVLFSDFGEVVINITVWPTSRVLYYGGTGAFTYVNETLRSWALPACRMSGTISFLSPTSSSSATKSIAINAEKSVTWYDRLWGRLGLRNGTSFFFALYLSSASSDLVISGYCIDSVDPPATTRFSNVRLRSETTVAITPIDIFEPSTSDVWTSPRTGRTYPQKWTLGVQGRGMLRIRSVRGDQEDYGEGVAGAAYSGFVDFAGVFDGRAVTGFGVVGLRAVIPG
ncbi:hypothetical protein ASPCAL00498 [Aspergillus calidoustus]|uniref:Uncharacterized protein n=1 Tax=Aspergillus calidoustus TaxID=454130 RepID=A0A0U5C155_ASPCI|nr:hypothetical protein ASPCAL00498 [Aspergillus calidoustus]